MGWATPYAKAVVALAAQAGREHLVALGQGIEAVDVLCQGNADVKEALCHPRWRSQRTALVQGLAKAMQLAPLATAIWRLLAQHGKMQQWTQFRAVALQHIDQALEQVRGEVTSAVALDGQAQKALQTALESFLPGQALVLTWQVDGQVLAGLRVRIGDLVIDTTLQSGLQRLSRQLSE